MSRKQRQALEHTRARGYAFADEPGALDEAHALHLSQSHAWGRHRPLPLDLSRRLLASGGAEPVARLYTLRSRHGLVSATLALESRHETFVWWSGTHAEGRRTHAFAYLLSCVGERAAAHGRRRLNLGASTGLPHVATFNSSLGAESFRYPVRRLDARAAGWSGRAIAALQRAVRRGRPEGDAR
jgi:GNAT acetyltransferase-like protein